MIVGVVSDTHGELHRQVLSILREANVEAIWHAGDVERYSVIEQLGKVAPVQAVCGNVDVSGKVALLPAEFSTEIEDVSVYMTHIGGKPGEWFPHLPEPKPRLAICGHSHKQHLEQVGETLFLNPGAAGPHRRFNNPLGLAIVRLEAGKVDVRLVQLD